MKEDEILNEWLKKMKAENEALKESIAKLQLKILALEIKLDRIHEAVKKS